MSHQITVAGVTTSLIAYQDAPVCTTQQLAEFYGCSDRNLTDNFQRNADRFEEGKHFIRLEGDAFRSFKAGLPAEIGEPLKFAPRAILWTEKGAARHAKMLTTEKAWEVYEQLEDAYFRVKDARSKPLSSAEMLVQMAQLNLDHERRLAATEQQQAAQTEELQRIDAKLDQVAESNVWTSRPANAEGISRIVKRIGEKYGLSGATIHEVMRQVPYNVKPAGMVRNDHDSAQGATYAVYWIADVNKVFARFVSECKRVTATQCTHPFIKGRFKVDAESGGQMPYAS